MLQNVTSAQIAKESKLSTEVPLQHSRFDLFSDADFHIQMHGFISATDFILISGHFSAFLRGCLPVERALFSSSCTIFLYIYNH
jgi:hypothetical protein